ncbi:DUF3021 domain-containing protein [Acutalibacter sp. LFL-21]|jgi:hypothetical protein|uniref:DUF3021 domain-containing protein n=1 Tax=Acutalibacter sp. LFL-21 TaxID=2983399 RepID=UPI0021D68DC6|nr:DUF3021 domain-containing protein [Acutalibacter sp. LFL-21]MCU7652165.1 DUF3021 domain-containing protein [Acutalibacter sp. LFL-21]
MSKAIKYGLLGLLCGSLAYLVFSILLSWKLGTGEFYFTIPALVNEYGNELLSASLQISTFLWLGMASGVAFSMIENMDWSPQKQSAGYLLTLTIGLIPTAFVGRWFEHLFIGFFSYLIILTGISVVLFIIGWIKLKRDVIQIKQAIALEKEDIHE